MPTPPPDIPNLPTNPTVWTGREIPANPPPIFQGSRVPLSAAAKKAATTGSSYMISNRSIPAPFDNPDFPWLQINFPNTQDYSTPLPNGEMNWFMSTARANDPDSSNYLQQGSSSGSVPQTFQSGIVNALNQQSGTSLQLAVFIHGLGNWLYPDAFWALSTLGANLAEYTPYPGLVIGFDWPSYSETFSAAFYATDNSYPPAYVAKPTTVRDNINGTVSINGSATGSAFANFLSFLGDLKTEISNQQKTLTISLICHSEGNYLAMLGFQYAVVSVFDHILMLAADVNSGAFTQADSNNSYLGYGENLSQAAPDITVYWTANDDVLPGTVLALGSGPQTSWQYQYHNWQFGERLGATGPAYNYPAEQYSSIYSVDCSGVINVANFIYLQSSAVGIIPANVDGGYPPSMHTSYLLIPQILQDMAQVMTGTSAGQVTNRMSLTVQNNNQAYAMTLNNNNNTN